ncbi:hypothetical protein [Rhodococcus qingshengii]|uniref:hypothetical protein n=1 Tax=Rhodococcus qingshengii TaxID=334542 RepID=UPI001C8B4315|nr:hypothetical protein [Rhodococcus qingshengii]MBX9147761.1 hypothetical protein [Rhodococcus qingshengii]
MTMIQAISRGYTTIALDNGARTEAAARTASQNSRTRTARGWRTVGNSIREQMSKTQK